MVEIEVQLPQDLSLTETWQFNLTKTGDVDEVKVNDSPKLGHQFFWPAFNPIYHAFYFITLNTATVNV